MPSLIAHLALWEHCGGLSTFPGMGQACPYLLGAKTSTVKKIGLFMILDPGLILAGSLFTFPGVSVKFWPLGVRSESPS